MPKLVKRPACTAASIASIAIGLAISGPVFAQREPREPVIRYDAVSALGICGDVSVSGGGRFISMARFFLEAGGVDLPTAWTSKKCSVALPVQFPIGKYPRRVSADLFLEMDKPAPARFRITGKAISARLLLHDARHQIPNVTIFRNESNEEAYRRTTSPYRVTFPGLIPTGNDLRYYCSGNAFVDRLYLHFTLHARTEPSAEIGRLELAGLEPFVEWGDCPRT